MISVTSSTIPSIVENSCSTPSIRTEEIANPSNDERSTLLRAFPTLNHNLVLMDETQTDQNCQLN